MGKWQVAVIALTMENKRDDVAPHIMGFIPSSTLVCIMHIYKLHATCRPGLCSTQIFRLTRLWLIWQSRWLNSDSTQHFTFLDWLNSDSTQFTNFLTWLNSDSTHLSQSWVKADSRLIAFYLIWPKVVDRGGGGVRPNVVVDWFFHCKTTDKCTILTFLFRNISASTLTQAVSSWLNSDSNDDQRDSTLTRLISFIFTADLTLTRLIWVRVESNLTHDS